MSLNCHSQPIFCYIFHNLCRTHRRLADSRICGEIEYKNGLDLANPNDGNQDKDFDFVSNADEFRSGTNPQDFFSVPLNKFNASYVIIILILILSLFLILNKNFIKTMDNGERIQYSGGLPVQFTGNNMLPCWQGSKS